MQTYRNKPRRVRRPTPGYGNLLRNRRRQYQKLFFNNRKFKSNFLEYDYPPLDAYYVDKRDYSETKKLNNFFSMGKALKRDITDIWEKHHHFLIEWNLNYVIEINTKSGLGKSLTALLVNYEHDQLFIKNFNETLGKELGKIENLDLKFSVDFSQSKNNFQNMRRGGTNIQDELNELVGSGAKSFEKAFRSIIKSFRFTQKNYILCTPDFVYLPNLHYILIPLGFKKGKKEKEWETRALVRYIDYSVKTIKPIFLGYVNLKVGKITNKLDHYENIKAQAYEDLENSGGLLSGNVSPEQKERDLKRLYDYAKEEGYKGKSKQELKDWLIFELEINAHTDYAKFLVNKTFNKFHREMRKKKRKGGGGK